MPNSAPIAVADSYSVLHDQTLIKAAPGVLANDSDPDNDPITAVNFTQPLDGYLSPSSDGSFTYEPNPGFTGTDGFYYQASDGALTSDPVYVTITVSDQPPVGNPDSYEIHQGLTLNVPVEEGVLANDSDPDSQDTLTAVNFTQPADGYLSPNSDGSFYYQPNAGFTGTDTFTYQASDGAETSDPVSVTINVTDTAPVGRDSSYSVLQGGSLIVSAPGVLDSNYDVDGDPLSTLIVSTTTDGSLSFSADGSFSYYPNPDFQQGTDSFTYRSFDGAEESNLVTVTISVVPWTVVDNDATTNSVGENAAAGTAVGITAYWQNPGSGSVTYSLTDDYGGRFAIDPTTGVVTVAAAGFVDYESSGGSYTIKAEATNGTLVSTEVAFTIQVNNLPPADPIDINTGPNTVIEHAATGTLVNINAFAPDPAGGTVTYSLTNDAGGRFAIDPNTGVVSVADGSLIDYASSGGSYTITAQASDGNLLSNEVSFNIGVTVNNGFQANDDYYYDGNYSVDLSTGALTVSAPGVLGNDVDVNDPNLVVTLVSSTSYGDLTLNSDGSFSYTPTVPKADYPGSDSFVYQISDGTNTATATVHINVDDPYHTYPKTAPVGTPARGATVVRGPGRYTFYYNSIVFITNQTVSGDGWCIWWQGGDPRYHDISNWGDVVNVLNGINNNTFYRIYLSGHGGRGGIQTQGPEANWLEAQNLTDAQVAAIRAKTRDGSAIVLLGCCQGADVRTQALATRLGVPVIASTGNVSDGNWADGSWVRFDP